MIKINAENCQNFEKSKTYEWLETNGIGGFAGGTVSGANSRRYHSILTAATKPPLGRLTLLSKFEETLFINNQPFELSSNQYPENVYPQGYQYLKSFRLEPFPIWTYKIEDLIIEKKVFMVHGQNTSVVEWKILNPQKTGETNCQIHLRPLLSFADYHALQSENSNFNGDFQTAENLVVIQPYHDLPKLFFTHNAKTVEKSGYWYRNFEYFIEKERGFDFHEDLFQPFILKFDLEETAFLLISTEEQKLFNALSYEMTEIARREALIMQAAAEDDFTKQLVLAADQFIVSRGEGKTVIAGYPWFSDWGRDTMISLSGLTLATNREEIAGNILLEFSKHISQGMIPNRFPDAGNEAEYNTVDATLWYFEAVRAFVEKTRDYDFVRKYLYEQMVEIVAWHVHGTRYHIRLDEDGLIYAGTPDVQLTWMDAKIDDWVVTPRQGKAVEIQALWYNALGVMASLAKKFGDLADLKQYEAMAKLTKNSFNKIFWNKKEECLFDVIDGEEKDSAVRPNQIFAVSLPHTMLSIGKARKVVEKVETELLTPHGLRSLSPKDNQYCPFYLGSPLQRDSAYHQGTVWAWLIGSFIDALRRVSPKGKNTEKRVEEILEGLKIHLLESGIGQISEIFDAQFPHSSRGCPAQAWSVGEVLRILKKQ